MNWDNICKNDKKEILNLIAFKQQLKKRRKDIINNDRRNQHCNKNS